MFLFVRKSGIILKILLKLQYVESLLHSAQIRRGNRDELEMIFLCCGKKICCDPSLEPSY